MLMAVGALLSCHHFERKPILSASREAPLGWVTIHLYADSSFELVNAGIRSSNTDRYPGTYRTVGDTLLFTYTDSIPRAGCEWALRTPTFIVFNGCLGSLQIHTSG